MTARQSLTALSDDKQVLADPLLHRAALEALLDTCIRSYDADCLAANAIRYANALPTFPAANAVQKQQSARKAGYYLDYARLWTGSADEAAKALAGPAYRHEEPADPELYVRRQLLAARLALAVGDKPRATRAVDKAMSLLASLDNPEAGPVFVASSIADCIDALLALGDTERAYGVYRVAGLFIHKTLPPLSVDAAVFHITEAGLLEEVGELKGAGLALDLAIDRLTSIELGATERERFLAEALTLKAVVCAAQADRPCADAALLRHPFANRYAQPGRLAASDLETTYLAARALVHAADGKGDKAAASGLTPTKSQPADIISVYRAAGAALAAPAGPGRQAGLVEAGRLMAAASTAPTDGAFGAWRRPGVVDQLVVGLALGQAGGSDEDAFTLFQLANRRGAAFDADALTALAEAKTPVQRRSIHQALRLRARRDRLERAQLQSVVIRAAGAAGQAPLRYDFALRGRLRDFADLMQTTNSALAKAGLPMSGSHLVGLKPFQAVLAPGEAALSVAPVQGGAAYLCVRRDAVLRSARPIDFKQVQLDVRILQAALTAGHAPSEALDSQFPAEAAARLYQALIQPFAGCLKPGDQILWLPNLSLTQLPLAALLPAPPPKTAAGYDLAAADWLVRHYAISYAGSASVVVADRSGGLRPGTDLDFLGVGDPMLAVRGAAAATGGSGLRLSDLAPLPETEVELKASAQNFRSAKLLIQAEATEAGVRGQLVGSYGLMSFATHGLLRDDLQGLSDPALVLTPVSQEPADDGLLTASEIADLNLSARFVALSACNTANFDQARVSQDLPALASAFAVAGTPATLATLWPVNSKASQVVVAGVFSRLKDGQTPADALAQSQRAFLAAPPARAYLHPRFWAPFVVMGDGGAEQRQDRANLRVTSVEPLTKQGGEVVALTRSGEQVLARFLSDRDGRGRYGAGARVTGPGDQTWRSDNRAAGATAFVARLGATVAAGGYEIGKDGSARPVLEFFAAANGAPGKTWRGTPAPGLSGFVLGGAALDKTRALVVIGELNLGQSKAAPRLRVMTLDERAEPANLFEIPLPLDASPDAVTLTPLGDAVVLTYAQRRPPGPPSFPAVEDDYDRPLCTPEPVTRIELRDIASGRLLSARTAPGWFIASSAARQGKVVLGGLRRSRCGEARAAAAAIADGLNLDVLFEDDALGPSETRSLSALGDGRLLLAISKQDLFDVPAPNAAKTAAILLGGEPPTKYGAMLVVLSAAGEASPPKFIDSGAYLMLSAADASNPADILVGGEIGGQAAILHLSTTADARDR